LSRKVSSNSNLLGAEKQAGSGREKGAEMGGGVKGWGRFGVRDAGEKGFSGNHVKDIVISRNHFVSGWERLVLQKSRQRSGLGRRTKNVDR